MRPELKPHFAWRGSSLSSHCPSGQGRRYCLPPKESTVAELDQEPSLDASNGSAPANTPLTVSIPLTPHNAVASVTLDYTNDNFNTTTPVTCTLSGTLGADDVWTATIPGQPLSTTVRFYIDATPYTGSDILSPANNVNYTYVAQ